MDSINYAHNIQESILPNLSEFKDCYQDILLFFKPKEVVSGDFYWMDKVGNKLIWAVVDCTGHGVPGSLMSMLGYNGLNKIILEENITEPTKILKRLSEHVETSFKKIDNVERKDGMEMGVCVMDIENKELQFSGSYNPCYIVREGKITILEAVRKQVGLSLGKKHDFKTVKFNLNTNDWIFMSTDGYADQFGGPKGKKFGYKQLRNLFVEVSSKPMEEQRQLLDTTFDNWIAQGNEEQIDDICVIGVKV